jgi:hypothetical protein
MKVTYLTGLIKHLLDHPDIVKVETLRDAGIEGPDWHPEWLRVVTASSGSIVLSIAATSPDSNDDSGMPDTFDPGDLDGGRQMSSVRGTSHG